MQSITYSPYKLQFSEVFFSDLYQIKLHKLRLSQDDLTFRCRKFVGKQPVVQLSCKDELSLPNKPIQHHPQCVNVRCVLVNTPNILDVLQTNAELHDPNIDIFMYAYIDFKNGHIKFIHASPYRISDDIDKFSDGDEVENPDITLLDMCIDVHARDWGIRKRIHDELDVHSGITVTIEKRSAHGARRISETWIRKRDDAKFRTVCTWSEPATYILQKSSVVDTVVSLNLHLAKWRFAPRMDLEALQNQCVLIVGCGSLGCHVIRTLLAYGVRKYILIDNGIVSPSTVVRQLFYTREDLGQKKVDISKLRIHQVLESADVETFDMKVPVFQQRDDVKDVKNRMTLLDSLIQRCDAMFLLTDNRESRWLPTVLGRRYAKRTLTCAIGFDTFVCMEHSESTGCYFCSDIIAPKNSTYYLTEDQKCTVALPGMSGISGGIISEIYATPFVDPLEENRSMQIRALHGLDIIRMQSHRNEDCVACGDHLTSAIGIFHENGDINVDKICECLDNPHMLEREDCKSPLEPLASYALSDSESEWE